MIINNALPTDSEENSQPIAIMRGSVLGVRNGSGEKVRKYRQKKRKAADDDSSDTEGQEPSNIEQPGNGKGSNSTLADQNKSEETRWVSSICESDDMRTLL
jgi:hypothetical protein